jgi:hypothetical protein
MIETKNSTNIKLIEDVKEYINNDEKLKKIFNHYNQKYTLDELLTPILFILKTGISYRDVSTITTIHWNTIYKFSIKLQKYDIIEKILKKKQLYI